MTVQSLLDMTSGIEWAEKAYTPDETIMRMYESPDHTAFVLNQPMVGAPGANFNYNGGNPYLLSALINKKSGQSALDFAKKELFEPLGIKSAKWSVVTAPLPSSRTAFQSQQRGCSRFDREQELS
jgi:CubicO group peptidase (beta-lactamase class C family)